MMVSLVKTVIVTHNSQDVLGECLNKLHSQLHIELEIVIVDSGSTDTDYLHRLQKEYDFTLVRKDNIGYGRANNLGARTGSIRIPYILFLNPDTFLTPHFVYKAVQKLESDPLIGVVSGKLLSYDPVAREPTGTIDSSGIFRGIYGRWYDRGRGHRDNNQFNEEADVPALCGALLICRKSAIENYGSSVFDPDFFLYKEDIELCLRLHNDGWKIRYVPSLVAFHCRGWSKRKQVPLKLKKVAAYNELLLYKKHPSPYIVWALLKYMAVHLLRI